MAYRILFTKKAKEDVQKLDSAIKKQLYKKLVYFQELEDIRTVAKKLHDRRIGEYRIRVGNYRILFDLDKHTIIVLHVGHRKEVYR